jgi:hypothetical protein
VKGIQRATKARSGASLIAGIGMLFRALLAQHDTAERANDADEGAAVGARVPFRRALLVVTGATNHRVAFAQNRAHCSDWDRREPKGFVLET